MVFFFVQTYLHIRRHNREKSPRRSSQSGNGREGQENRLAVMFMAIVAVFFLCHSPRFDRILCLIDRTVMVLYSLSLFRIIMDVCETMWRQQFWTALYE